MEIETLTIIFWLGVSLILTATLVVGIFAPIKDKTIKKHRGILLELKHRRDVALGSNWQDYQNATLKEKVIRLTSLYLKSEVASDDDQRNIYEEYLEARKTALGKLYIIAIGEIPPANKISGWEGMSFQELLDEDKKMRPEAEKRLQEILQEITQIKNKIENLEREMSNLIIIAGIVQVSGLLLLNIFAFFNK
jgi:hypothetical protein